ncbi:AraC family transcriptional regulator [Brevundimonas variabilis]|uniref:AraC-like DNA-binding protein n=1 Tax=Brevundimonas variabilis TaxID=74312 RepID=A0A7W9FEG7_9CAUL|nr:helix-turn-helix domain-containing protein [Brevundimonas variabilis]MBB5744523.1 AraC-like DNA-binding protein [Brevundimonas variabilis]
MGDFGLTFGWRTALLLTLSVQMLAFAVALSTQDVNRTANRLLAAFLLVATGVVTPYTIGFAGAYDAWKGLTFAPFALPLFLAPLLYGYTYALIEGRLPARWRWHLAPGFAQLGYMAIAFLLPFDTKMAWADVVDGPWVSPVFSIGVLLGLVAYSAAALRLLRRFRAGLADERSDDERYAARWLGRILAAMLVTTVFWAGWQGWHALSGFDYFEFFGLHMAVGVIGVLLGVEGWRHAGLRFRRGPVTVRFSDPEDARGSAAAEPDWPAIAADYAGRTREAGWWREPELSLPRLARYLGTNTGRLSRAINTGLGVNFSVFVNGLRAEAVAQALTARPSADLLDLAFEMGFASKASFNRAFLARYGTAPSRYRQEARSRVSDHEFEHAAPNLRRADA